ncbi:MAG: hypothetical protein KF727_11200 [Microbacteriaceae bacterium]|nr:hypothetical protein [Microbacteriaceae bacterium]
MEFIAVNTIGLSGAELIAAELARYPDVLMLPGQNFIGFRTTTYRPHDYSGWAADDVFANLAKLHITRQGRVWSGLTKVMTPEQLERYDAEGHRAEFERLAAGATTTIDHWKNFATSFARASGDDADYPSFGFFGFNMVLSADHYPDFLDRSVLVDFVAPVDFWLANIGQRAVWDCLGAMGFWLTNMLVVRRWAGRHPDHYVRVDARAFASDSTGTGATTAAALGFTGEPGELPPGFVRFSPEVFAATESIADDLRAVYTGWAPFDLALRFDEWADDFLAQPGTDELLDRFVSFWNTTSHTNLDWPGPVAERVVDAVVAWSGASSSYSPARWFYHECFWLTSDNWETATGELEHYLGDLEDEIPLPATAAHARIVLLYLENVAGNIVKRAYSALPIRETSLYRRLRALEPSFGPWAMTDRVAEVEARIDEADEAMAKFSQ